MTKDEQREEMGQYYPGVVNFFKAKGFSLEESRELSQITFFRVLKSWKNYRGEGLWAYLLQTAIGVWKNEIRSRGVYRRYFVEAADEVFYSSYKAAQRGNGPESPDSIALNKEAQEEQEARLRQLEAAIMTLPDGQREALLLYLQGMKGKDIAPLLGISHAAVRTRISQARHRLRIILEPK